MFFKFFAYVVVYMGLFFLGIKFYLWGRRQQKKQENQWSRRMGLWLFFAPVLIFLIDLCIPLPESLKSPLQFVVNSIDYTMVWIKSGLQPVLGTFGYALVKPIISALLYALLGFVIGSIIDCRQKK